MKELTKRQMCFIKELFESGGDEAAVVKKYRVSETILRKWFCQKEFHNEMAFRLASVNRQSKLLLAKYIPLAAAKLVELCASEKEETARKACLDILQMNAQDSLLQSDDNEPIEKTGEEFSSEMSSKLLAVLAENEQDVQDVCD